MPLLTSPPAALRPLVPLDLLRFKGRDANRKLQRSIRAAKVRDRLPDMLEAATAALAAWATATGGPFLFDGEDFAATRLPGYRAEVEALVQARAEGRERARAKASPGGGDVGAARADRTSSSRRSSDAGWNSSTATRPASATPQAASRQPSGGGATPASAASRPGSAAKIRSAVKTPPTAKAPASDAKGTADDQCASNIPTPVAITYT